MLGWNKCSNPMCLIHFEELGLYVYASIESIMTKALKKAEFHKLHCYKIEFNEGNIIKIDCSGYNSCSQFKVKDNCKCSKWFSWYSYVEDELYNEHEQMLLKICRYFGIDEHRRSNFTLISYNIQRKCIELVGILCPMFNLFILRRG